MGDKRIVFCAVSVVVLLLPSVLSTGAAPARIYNTAKQKLMDGKPIVGGGHYEY